MPDLMLDSLEINNFRLFKHLEIERLRRVNLIVGKNGVGKTALLEALRLFAYQANPLVVAEMLNNRDEVGVEMARSKAKSNDEWFLGLRHLFYGRPDLFDEMPALSIGPMHTKGETLFVEFRVDQTSFYLAAKKGHADPQKDHIEDVIGGGEAHKPFSYLLSTDLETYARLWTAQGLSEVKCLSVTADGLSDNSVAALWDDIVLTDLEEVVSKALRIIVSEVQRLNFILSDPQRIPVVKVESLSYPIPLRSLGAGMNRLLGIALALVNAKDGMLLIDEIESGLHYSVQPDMWRLVFETAAGSTCKSSPLRTALIVFERLSVQPQKGMRRRVCSSA